MGGSERRREEEWKGRNGWREGEIIDICHQTVILGCYFCSHTFMDRISMYEFLYKIMTIHYTTYDAFTSYCSIGCILFINLIFN